MEPDMSTLKRKHTTDRARLVKEIIDSTERNDQFKHDSHIKSGENLRLHEEYGNVENKLKIITTKLEELERKLEQTDKDLNSAQKEKERYDLKLIEMSKIINELETSNKSYIETY